VEILASEPTIDPVRLSPLSLLFYGKLCFSLFAFSLSIIKPEKEEDDDEDDDEDEDEERLVVNSEFRDPVPYHVRPEQTRPRGEHIELDEVDKYIYIYLVMISFSFSFSFSHSHSVS